MIRIISFLSIALLTVPVCAQIEANTSFVVFSDPHYYDPSLGTEGEAFSEYLDGDRKLLAESKELLSEAIGKTISSDADFVIIPGDLTKDGTKVSHENFADMIRKIIEAGKPVYVVPGNHDISNGEANGYKGNEKIHMENVGPEGFLEIYHDFGYSGAIEQDTNSLSYVIEPSPGIWMLALDACLYQENEEGHHPETDGEFKPETLEWIEKVAIKGAEQNKLLLAFMHHGVLEHYQKQDKFYGEYVVNNYKKVSKKFASLGIKVVFTGHYHAQDITTRKWNDGTFITDIETGSLVTYPNPLRKVEILNNQMHITSDYITSIPMHSEGFSEYSREYVHDGVSGIAEEVMVSMRLNREEAQKLSGQIADAFIAHYKGDEEIKNNYLDLSGVGFLGRIMILTKKRLIKELYTDLPPADNELIINLQDGSAQ